MALILYEIGNYLEFRQLCDDIYYDLAYFKLYVNKLLTYYLFLYIIAYVGGGAMSSKKAKREILKQTKSLNLHPEKVKAIVFHTHPFFDPEDKAQVKYEMLRAREVERAPLGNTCSEFGFSRESYRQILKRFSLEGIAALFGQKRGRKGPVKATKEVREFVRSELNKDNAFTTDDLIRRCQEEFNITLSRRTIFRILEKEDGGKKKR